MYYRDVYDEFVGKIARRCYEYGIGFTVTIKPGYIKTWYLSVFGEHYSKEYAIDVDQLPCSENQTAARRRDEEFL